MLVKIYGAAVCGVDASLITVEVDVRPPYGYKLVGLPDKAVAESYDRILTAVQHSGFIFPRLKVTINMSPADIRKEGAAYDLSLTMGILAASGQADHELMGQFIIMGELSLDGSLLPVRGALPMAILARELGFRGLIIPAANFNEASIVTGIEVVPVRSLTEAAGYFNGTFHPDLSALREAIPPPLPDLITEDFADVRGQENIKRALEVAAAGGHNLILIGPPGAGKTMLARRLPSILPPLSLQEALETTKIHSVAGKTRGGTSLIEQRPFRSPHHTISDIALVGGGTIPHPGEISLAHNGVLFLDELPEFKRAVLEVLRQPIEERRVTVSRARSTIDFPANFMLVASMNPCPCGFHNHPAKECICPPQQVQRYMSRISGPLLDRIDLHAEVTPVDFAELSARPCSETSSDVRARVVRAREIQQVRFAGMPGIFCNAMMPPGMVREIARPDAAGEALLKTAMERLNFSARAFDRILKVARTVADLGSSEAVQAEHIAEAIQYRSLDRDGWTG